MRRILPALVFTSCLLVGLPVVSWAQTNPGFTFTWGGDGPSAKQQLKYVLDYGTPGHLNDRYRLKLGTQKVAISGITISYQDYYTGKFDAKSIELRVGVESKFFGGSRGKALPTKIDVDQENRLIQLTPEEVIPAGTSVEVILSNVKNPSSGGMYYFNARISSPGDVPLMRYIGTWILSIART